MKRPASLLHAGLLILYPAAPRLLHGQGGIRTHDTVAGIPVFETGSFSHSDTCPAGCKITEPVSVRQSDGPTVRRSDGQTVIRACSDSPAVSPGRAAAFLPRSVP